LGFRWYQWRSSPPQDLSDRISSPTIPDRCVGKPPCGIGVFSPYCNGLGPRSQSLWLGPALRSTWCGCYKAGMGTHGACARVTVSRFARGRRGRGRRVLFIVSIGLLPALAGCSSFSSSSSPPPPSASTSSSVPTFSGPASARGGVSMGTAASGTAADDSGPSGILVDVFRHNSTPATQTAAMAPASSVATSSAVPTFSGPASARGGVSVGPAPSSPSADDSGPSGFLVDLFRPNSTPSAPPSNMPHPPSTYTASAPPYTPPPGQAAAPAPPPPNSPQ
jgi:hypothetical protein